MKKKSKIFICIFIMILVFFLGWFLSNRNNSIYNKISKINNSEKSKYNEMLRTENKEDISNYLVDKVDSNDIIQIEVMDYLFKNVYKDASDLEKYLIFYTYYKNIQTHISKYENLLNNPSYLEIMKKYFGTTRNISPSKINKIDNYLLQTILTEMYLNDFTIYLNEPYMQVYFNWKSFLEKFDKILDDDYKEFCKLEVDGSNVVLNPNYTSINMAGVIWYITTYEDYIKNAKNPYLKTSAEEIYIQNLYLLTGVTDNGLFYSLDYNVSKNYIEGFKLLLEKYPSSDTSKVVQEVYDYIIDVDGEEDVSSKISTIVYNYLEGLKWLSEELKDGDYYIY